MGSIPGAYLAAVIIAEVKALCIGVGVVHLGSLDVNFSKLTLVAEFIVMAAVLILRPYGLFGSAIPPGRPVDGMEPPLPPAPKFFNTRPPAFLLPPLPPPAP